MTSPQPKRSGQPPLRSWSQLQYNKVHVTFSPVAQRLFWQYEGSFPNAISVMKVSGNAKELEPLFQPSGTSAAEGDGGNGSDGAGTGTWHAVAHEPVTQPPVSSLRAAIEDLDQWESDWLFWHQDHESAEFVTYGDLSDEDRPFAEYADEDGNWEADSDTEFKIRMYATLTLERKAVHPWLMSLRDDIVRAKSVARTGGFPSRTRYMVTQGPRHVIEERGMWMDRHGAGRAQPPMPISAGLLAAIQAHREWRNRGFTVPQAGNPP
ncbi:hypothetical protein TruAng_011740 [Truncatella angustata]|nr:hypothetical protein TruAng_011740 [Truncatella angustata]